MSISMKWNIISPRIWTQVADSITNKGNRYAKRAFLK